MSAKVVTLLLLLLLLLLRAIQPLKAACPAPSSAADVGVKNHARACCRELRGLGWSQLGRKLVDVALPCNVWVRLELETARSWLVSRSRLLRLLAAVALRSWATRGSPARAGLSACVGDKHSPTTKNGR